MSQYSFNASAQAPIDLVWAVLADHRGMPAWTPLRSVELEREGDPPPDGLGAIRVLHALGPALREEVVTFEPPRAFAYRLLSGAPVRDYLSRVELGESATGTTIEWSVSFTPRVPGVQLVVKQVISSLVKGLVKESERRAAA